MKTHKLKFSKPERTELKMLLHFWLMFKDNWLLILLNYKLPSPRKKISLTQPQARELETKTYLTMLVTCAMLSILNTVTALVLEERKSIFWPNWEPSLNKELRNSTNMEEIPLMSLPAMLNKDQLKLLKLNSSNSEPTLDQENEFYNHKYIYYKFFFNLILRYLKIYIYLNLHSLCFFFVLFSQFVKLFWT